jgi:Xaa-Pro aminopeptidase
MTTARQGLHADFPKAEYEARWRRAWALMRAHGLDGLLVTGKANHRYLSGHYSEFSISTSRPMFTLLAQSKRPIVLTAFLEKDAVRETSWVADARTYVGFADDAIPPLLDAFADLGLGRGRVGVDFGQEMHLALPLTVFRRLERKARGLRFVDGSPALWRLRQLKSPAEIDLIRKSCRASGLGLKRAFAAVRAGMTEREFQHRLMAEILRAGADAVPFLPIHSGPGNYGKGGQPATDRRIRAGDIVWSDPACTVKGYYSDFDRMVAVGRATREQRDLYRLIREVTEACVDACRAGRPIADAVRTRDRAYKKLGLVETSGFAGRMGHASGLDMTEPPSVALFDRTVLEPGMIIHLEPKMARPYGAFLLEEVVAVSERGAPEYLAPRAPKDLPVV